MTTAIVRVLRLVSIAICLIVIASFGVFAINQTKGASAHQQEELNPTSASAAIASAAAAKNGSSEHEGSPHKALTEASNALTSPFSGIVNSSSEWETRGVKVLLALLLYGFGIGYLARVVRVRI